MLRWQRGDGNRPRREGPGRAAQPGIPAAECETTARGSARSFEDEGWGFFLVFCLVFLFVFFFSNASQAGSKYSASIAENLVFCGKWHNCVSFAQGKWSFSSWGS